MNPIVPPFVPFPPPPRVRPFPPPPPPENPFPTLDTEPMATKAELNAEIARATAAESGIVAAATEAAVAAAVESVDDELDAMRASVTAAVSGANAAADRAVRVTSGVATQAAREAVAGAMEAGFIKSSQAAQIADAAAQGVLSVVSVPISNIPSKADKSYVDACLKKAVVMTQSPDGLSQIQIGNDGVPFVLVAKPFKAVWTDSSSGEHKFSWTATEWTATDDSSEEFRYVEDASTATSGRTIILREAKTGAYLTVDDNSITVSNFAPTYTSGVYSGTSSQYGGSSIVAYQQRVTKRNIVTEAAT